MISTDPPTPPPTPEPTPGAKLATVDQLLRAWADEPAADLASLLELVERIRRVVAS